MKFVIRKAPDEWLIAWSPNNSGGINWSTGPGRHRACEFDSWSDAGMVNSWLRGDICFVGRWGIQGPPHSARNKPRWCAVSQPTRTVREFEDYEAEMVEDPERAWRTDSEALVDEILKKHAAGGFYKVSFDLYRVDRAAANLLHCKICNNPNPWGDVPTGVYVCFECRT